MNSEPETDVLIIGGGLAGLSNAIQLSRAGLKVSVVEKKSYPFHRVCGEYLSNEALPFLKSLGVDYVSLQPAAINRFLLTSPAGKTAEALLGLGGFGISRFTLDHHLYKLALQKGVTFQLKTTVEKVEFSNDVFTTTLSDGTSHQSKLVIAAYGKRTNLDRQLNRKFFSEKSAYLGVKYHLKTNLPKDLITLHNFENGYAGISAVENDRFCFCYLSHRSNLKKHGTIAQMEKNVLMRNPLLRKVFEESKFLFDKPEVINEISFAPKTCVENHILCCGDAAGMITPLCGNGMAMALHASKILATEVIAYFQTHRNRQLLEVNYTRNWQRLFSGRLKTGRLVQKLFGREVLSDAVVSVLNHMPAAFQFIIKQTHGKPF